MNIFPLNFGLDGAGDGRFCRTASVSAFLMVDVGSFKDTMKIVCVDLCTEGLTGVQKVIARVGRQDFYLGRDGGYMIPIYSNIGQGMRSHFEKW